MSETFGQYLKRRREAAGLTQAELAGRVGVTPTYIGYLERGSDTAGIGQQMRPMIEVVDAIAEALAAPAAEVRCAAGYDPPANSGGSCEVVCDTLDEGDFAALHRMHEKLEPERRRAFRPVLRMVRRELESLLKEQGAEPEVRPSVRRRGLNTSRAARPELKSVKHV
jgi:transcriptional regulator with XRE-family HTH domain